MKDKGKRKGRHQEKLLTAAEVKRNRTPGRYPDGGTLYLEVSPSGSKSWIQRVVIGGRRVDLGLGGVSTVTLAEARDAAAVNRKLAREGKDPRELRRKREAVPTFCEAATIVHTASLPTWRNDRHAVEWLRSLTEYAVPTMGTMPVDQVENRDVIAVLAPIWLSKAETARRVLQRIKAILDWSHAKGHRAVGLDAAAVRKGLPKQSEGAVHHPAVPYAKVPEFVTQLRAAKVTMVVQLAFELLILTAARTSEVLFAEPHEFDLEAKVWTVPPGRMKAKKEHRVPLTPRAIEIVTLAKTLGGQKYLFPGRRKGRPLSNMALVTPMRRLKVAGVPHGFRSSFRDWAAESTNFPNIVCEAALAHTVPDKVEAAYRRTDLYAKRQKLMAKWEQHVCSEKADVVPLRMPA